VQRDAAGSGNGSFADFVSDWGEFITGVDLPFGPSPGKLSSVQAPHSICSLSYSKHTKAFTTCTDEAYQSQIDYWRNLSHHFDSKGWLPLLSDYTVRKTIEITTATWLALNVQAIYQAREVDLPSLRDLL